MDLSLLPVDQHGKEQDCCPTEAGEAVRKVSSNDIIVKLRIINFRCVTRALGKVRTSS